MGGGASLGMRGGRIMPGGPGGGMCMGGICMGGIGGGGRKGPAPGGIGNPGGLGGGGGMAGNPGGRGKLLPGGPGTAPLGGASPAFCIAAICACLAAATAPMVGGGPGGGTEGPVGLGGGGRGPCCPANCALFCWILASWLASSGPFWVTPSHATGRFAPLVSLSRIDSLTSCVTSWSVLPKMSGRVPARLTKLREISSSDARVLSLIFESMASRCSFHRGSIRLTRMCSAMSAIATNSPVIGETANLVGSYAWPRNIAEAVVAGRT
mmetsp:Transcript_17751/g.30413  ORF Transcript_17751/g.30413 Transcript_17751/m.30413 type:complete len:267 (-) Transcript_17751:1306-2106(-)